MRKFVLLAVIMTVTLPNAYSQMEDRNYGDLLPESHFQIKHEKTILKDNADISNYDISVTPKKDEFTYKVNSVRTPRPLLGKKKEFKLLVEREADKVRRISSVSFNASESSGVHAVQSTSINQAGYVESHTNCYDQYKHGLFGTKKAREGFKCVTVTEPICEYLDKHEISSALLDQIHSCSNIFNSISVHQDNLQKLSKNHQNNDLAALKRIKSKISGTKNFFELENKTLTNLSDIVTGYGSALSNCEYLRDSGYFPPKSDPASGPELKSGKGNKQ